MTVRASAQRLTPVARTLPWAPLLAGALLCGLLAALVPLLGDASPLERWPGFGALALCIGAAFLFDDDAAATTAATPTSLARRRLLRLALGLPLLAVVWAGSLWYATSAHDAPFGPETRAALSLQLGALLALTLGASAIALRVMPGEQGGWIGVTAPLALLGLAFAMPDRIGLLALPADAGWQTAQACWAVVLAIGLSMLAWAVREPSPRATLRRCVVQPPPA